MKQDEQHLIHAIRHEGDAKVATLLDALFSRVEQLEREVRQLRTTTAGLAEHVEVIATRSALDVDGFRQDLARGIRSVAGRSELLVQSGAAVGR